MVFWAGLVLAAPMPLSPDKNVADATSWLSMLEDPGRNLGITQVSKPPWVSRFKPVTKRSIQKGLSGSAWWIRLEVESIAQAHASWLIQLVYPQFDQVDFYFLPETGPMRRLKVGDHRPFSARAIPHQTNVLPLELKPGQTGCLYVRIAYREAGIIKGNLKVWNPTGFQASSQQETLLVGIVLGCLVFMAALNLFLWLSMKSPQYGWYSAYLAGLLLMLLANRGYGYRFIWHNWHFFADMLPRVGNCLVLMVACQFTRSFLGTKQKFPKIDKLLLTLIVIFTLPLPFCFPVMTPAGVKMVMATSLASMALPIIGYYIWAKGQRAARFYALGWTFWLLGILCTLARYTGLFEYSFLLVNLPLLFYLVECTLLYMALVDRFSLLRVEKERAELIHREYLENAKAELEAKVAERTEELEKSRARAEALARVDGLTGLLNRRSFFDQGELTFSQAKRHGRKMSFVMLDIDHFKKVNDRHGHAVGDEVLKTLAKLIQSQKRESDLAGRLGGEEFALMLPESEKRQAEQFAERLRAAVTELVVKADGAVVKFTASFGVAELAPEDEQIKDTLNKADKALYAAKNAGRNLVRAS